ncbi:MAG: DUF697 domain-containing protein [Xanthobacteraceae bacterium]
MKKLPRAVLLTREDLRAATGTDEAPSIAPLRQVGRSEQRALGSASAAPGNVVELTPKPQLGTPARDQTFTIPAAPILEQQAAATRRSRARVIVERHATYAAFGGCVPLPVVNASGVMAIIVRMVSTLSKHYGVPFERQRTRALVMALMGGATPVGLAVGAASTILTIVPGTQLLGIAISSVTAAACTRDIGLVFLDIFEKGGMVPATAPAPVHQQPGS